MIDNMILMIDIIVNNAIEITFTIDTIITIIIIMKPTIIIEMSNMKEESDKKIKENLCNNIYVIFIANLRK
jgi:hypothetical protein